MADGSPKRAVLAAETHDQSVPGWRCGAAPGPAYTSLPAGPPLDVLALLLRGRRLTDHGRLRRARPRVGTPSLRGKPCATTRRPQALACHTARLLPPAKARGQPLPPGRLHRLPEPSGRRVPRVKSF